MIDLFTESEVRRAQAVLKDGGVVNQKLYNVVTEKVMQRIDEQTGQQNDRRYMTYRLEYIAATHRNKSAQ
ncbi:MAG: hypothetical protein JST16_01605 [Bdellovibrionales bacterium]|nr:hypothetical protein [Bdellovibrionales bacterium]